MQARTHRSSELCSFSIFFASCSWVRKRPSSAALDKEDKDDEDEEAMLLRRLEEVRARKSERAVERAAKTG